MYVSQESIRKMEAKYGKPQEIEITQNILDEEMRMLRSSQKNNRAHDVTFFIFNEEGQVVVTHKHINDPGVYRAPSGGIKPNEDFERAVLREALEETGLDIVLEKYLLRCKALFYTSQFQVPWTSHVFTSRHKNGTLQPIDTEEIACARYVSLEELQGPIRKTILNYNKGLLHYRIKLTDVVIKLLTKDPNYKQKG